MKKLKRMIALLLALCMVLTGITPAYADVETVSEATAFDPVILEEDETVGIVEEASPAEAEYDLATPSDAEHIALEKPEKDSEENVAEKATPSNAKREEKDFVLEKVVDGIKITLTADPGVFPEEAELWAERVEDEAAEEAIEEAVEKERDIRVNVAKSYKFDIKMLAEGEEVQPDTDKGSVKVTFILEEKLNDCLTANAYHLKEEADGELTAENLDAEVKTVEAAAMESASEDTLLGEETLSDGIMESDAALNAEVTEIEAEITGFSYYVVEFTYNDLQYVLCGGESVKLSKILSALGLTGKVTAAEVSDEELFRVTKDTEAGDWTVTALRAFRTKEWLKVVIGEQVYVIAVTDEVGEVQKEIVKYIDKNGIEQEHECILMTSSDDYLFEAGGWYAIKGDVTIKNRINNGGLNSDPSHLILVDGATLNAQNGIHTGNGSQELYLLEIFGQQNGTGTLIANVSYQGAAAIGGDDKELYPGNVTINGGTIIAKAKGGAGIGGGNGLYGTVTINGGTVTATAGAYGAGIGGGFKGYGTVIINGGTVTATGANGSAGIGGGNENSGYVTIRGGTVIAAGGPNGCGIGSGVNNSGSNITIEGGTVTATAGKGSGSSIGQGTVTINSSLRIYAGASAEAAKLTGAEGTDEHYAYIAAGIGYTVRHYRQKADASGYEVHETETLYGCAGRKTEAAAKSYDGFTAQSITQNEISADGGTVVEIRYNRNVLLISFDTRGVSEAPGEIKALYGAPVTVDPEEPSAPGYIFEGWCTDSECIYIFVTPQTITMPSENITLYAKWRAKTDTSYKVCHYYQNIEGTGYLPPETEDKAGTTGEDTTAAAQGRDGFAARSFNQQKIKGDGSTVVEIYYDRKQYTITFDANGHGTAPESITAYYEQAVSEPKRPKADGEYIFDGWFEDSGCTVAYTFSKMPFNGKSLYAKWTYDPSRIHTVTWMLDAETVIDTTKAGEGDMPEHADAKAPYGYLFDGWEPALAPVEKDTTYTARFRKDPDKWYMITWKTDTGETIDTTEVLEGEMPGHDDARKEGWLFAGWNPFVVKADSDAVYTAMFVLCPPDKLAVAFDTAGGSFVPSQVIEKGKTAVRPEDPEKDGYLFDCWYEDTGYATAFDFGKAITADTTVYAKWKVLPATVYTVTWKLDDGSLINTTKVKAGDMPVHDSPVKDGYIFLGWNPDLSPVTGDITYTAKFEQRTPDKAAVTFNTDGGSFVETQIVLKGQNAVRPSNPAKSGYRFVNWYADTAYRTLYDFSKAVTADITLYAKWERNAGKEYTITWKDWNGAVLATSKVTENGLPKYPGTAKPVRSGYTFTGWTPEIDLATADKTYTATYVKTSGGGGGGGGTVSTTQKAAPTFSSNWYSDELGVWRIRNSAGQTVVNAWLCDDVIKANGQNVWYLLREDGAMIANGLVQDKTGNFYSLETEHNGYFGMLRYQNGTYNCNGQQVYLTFNHEHNGSFGAITNAEGLEKLKAIYGVTKYGIGNENSVYTAAF